MHLSKLVALTVAASALSIAQAANAAVINVATSGGVTQDRNLISTGPGNATGVALNVGEVSTDTLYAKPYIPFTLATTDLVDVLTPGATATLRLVSTVAANPTAYTLSLIGLPGQGSDPVAVTADYSAAGTTLITGITPAAQVYTFDVSAYVAAQALTNSVVTFRIDLVGLTVPNTSLALDGVTFVSADNTAVANRPTLTITPGVAVPEPTSIAALAAVLPCLLRRRNRTA